MESKIKVFENEEFGKIRTLVKDGEPWFVGKDVAVILGYAKPENAIAAHVDSEDKTSTLIQGTGSNYKSKTTIINESGFYSLVLSSKMPRAKEFKRWVTAEILPTILERKQGEITSYGAISGRGQELYSPLTIQAEQQLSEDLDEDYEPEMGGISL